MIYRNTHRLVKEIDKMKARGQVLHFLTGDGINDIFFYSMYLGIRSMSDTLRQRYLDPKETDAFDVFIHFADTQTPKAVYLKGRESGVTLNDVLEPPNRQGALKRRTSSNQKQSREREVAQSTGEAQGNQDATNLERMSEIFQRSEKKYLILLENFEWIAKLHEATPIIEWIAKIKAWENLNNVMTVVTIKDMELLKKYGFTQEDIFVGYPPADEIAYAYIRYIMRNSSVGYTYSMTDIDDLAHAMSVGKKSLRSCMRVLKAVMKNNPRCLDKEDFADSFEKELEEKVPWEKVRLQPETKIKIMAAVDQFMLKDPQEAMRGIVFTGPPGTGKTLIAKSLAEEKQCYFMAPTLADLKGEYVGQSSAKVKRVFAEARANQPTILFIDEADTVFPGRNLGVGNTDSYGMDMVNQFLQEIDGAKSGMQRIFVIAATNRPEAIDDAIMSRLGKESLEIPLPDYERRKEIFQDNFGTKNQPFQLKGKSYEDYLLTKSEKMSGRDIMNFVKRLKTLPQYNCIKNDENSAREILAAEFAITERYFIEETFKKGTFSRENVVYPNQNKKRAADIVGMDAAKAAMERQMDYIMLSEERKTEYTNTKTRPTKGLLLYGPPGNGKSQLVESMAGEKHFYFFKVISKDFVSGYDRGQIERLDNIFSEITRLSKMTDYKGIVLFFDEFDALAGKQNMSPVVRGSLLNYIADENGIRDPKSKILFVAATNFIENIDEAIMRPGRIDEHVEMDNPSSEEALRMLDILRQKENVVEEVTQEYFDNAYSKLKEEKQRNYEKQHYGLYWRTIIPIEQHTHIESQINDQRPSGADLAILYNTLKELALRNRSFSGDKLLFTDNILRERFPSYTRD